MKTNIYAPFWIIKAAVPNMRPGSCIIATASEQAYDPAANLYDYAQTKAATMNYVKSLAKQLGPKGIRVNGVAPGPVWTPLQVSGGATQEHSIHFGQTYPLGRAGQPAALASIYVQLAANDASYTTGHIYMAPVVAAANLDSYKGVMQHTCSSHENRACADTLRQLLCAYGPNPLTMDEGISRRYINLDFIYLDVTRNVEPVNSTGLYFKERSLRLMQLNCISRCEIRQQVEDAAIALKYTVSRLCRFRHRT